MTQLFRVFCLFLIAGLIAGTSSGQEVDYFHELTVPLTISADAAEGDGNQTHLRLTLPTPIAVSAEDPAFLEMDFDLATTSCIPLTERCLFGWWYWQGPEYLIMEAKLDIYFHDGSDSISLQLAPSLTYFCCACCPKQPSQLPRQVTPNATVNLADHLTSGDDVFNVNAISVTTTTFHIYMVTIGGNDIQGRPIPDSWQVEASAQLEGLRSIRVFKPGDPAVVLIHGFNGSDASWGGSDAPNLKSLLESTGRKVKFFSHEGTDIPIYTLADRLEDSLEAWDNELAITERGVDLVAHSMGGLIARYYISHYANNVNKLVTLATPHYGTCAANQAWFFLRGSIQSQQQELGSRFLWDLHHDWQTAPLDQMDVLCIVGTWDNNPLHALPGFFAYYYDSDPDQHDDMDGLVPVNSANLEGFGIPTYYVPKAHTGGGLFGGGLENGIAYITDETHPSYSPIVSFLEGQMQSTPPEDNVGNPAHPEYSEIGAVMLTLKNEVGDQLPIEWVNWPPGALRRKICGRNDSDLIYFAGMLKPGTHSIVANPNVSGYQPGSAEITVHPHRTDLYELTSYPADASATNNFAGGDTEPRVFGNTGVTMDFSSGPGGSASVYRFDDNPPGADSYALPHYWDIDSDFSDSSFSVTVTFDYEESEVLAAGLTEEELIVAYYDTLWNPMITDVDTDNNQVSVNTSHFSLFGIGDFPPVLDTGSVSGFIIANSQGPVGVPVDLYDSTGTMIASTVSDDSGWYQFPGLDNGYYSVSISTPLGYQADEETKQIKVRGLPHEVSFELIKLEITPTQSSMGYWKHQVNVHLSGRGDAQESLADISNYMGLIVEHFNNNLANPITIFEVPQPATQTDSLEVLQALLRVNVDGTMNDRAKQQLIALMLNVVSLKLHQTTSISEDSATVSQAITYCNQLITDSDPSNDEIAKHVADDINNGILVASGIIPLTTPNIAYKGAEDQIDQTSNLPEEFSLEQNYPNPFNPVCQIQYTLPTDCQVAFSIYNILGQKVRVLVDGYQSAGYKSVKWDGKDDQGREVTSGIYFYRIQAGDFTEAKKMLLLK